MEGTENILKSFLKVLKSSFCPNLRDQKKIWCKYKGLKVQFSQILKISYIYLFGKEMFRWVRFGAY